MTKYNIFKFLTDETYIKLKYFYCIHKKINLKHPKTFNEKINWLKLYDRNKDYSLMVDKFEVKEYISKLIGEQYIIPSLGIFDKFDDINFETLPNSFVIKCTHDSGGIVLVKNKSDLDIAAAKKKIESRINNNYFYHSREWPYKYVKPRIMIEEYMTNNNEELIDYKIHNFNGVPKIILVCKDRYKDSGLTEDFFDINWQHLDIKRPKHDCSCNPIDKPKQLNQMIDLSKIISKNIPFVRTDFYIINDKIYLGEITFYPASGFEKFIPEEWDYKLGEMLNLSNDNYKEG